MKKQLNKTLKRLTIGLSLALLSSCVVVVDDTPGPPGPAGDAYFMVDFEDYPPYSYWDNNPSIPNNPTLGVNYFTHPGLYDFEYFINPQEYWYGTYEIWLNAGGPGLPHGEPGYRGLDTYLTLICDPYGFHEHRGNGKTDEESAYTKPLVIEERIGNKQYRITIQKAKVSERPAQAPKFVR